MSIRQPSQTIIDARSLQTSSYSFAVESILDSVTSPGRLTVSASSGYLLTTSLNNCPRQKQFFSYIPQADGSWIASGNAIVSSDGETTVDGTIVVQDSRDERVTLSIAATSGVVKKPHKSTLAINQPTLNFAPTVPGKPSYLILTIMQQPDNAPVTLTTDATDVFQLATDSSPRFAPAVTFNPSPVGSYVHVRYMAGKRGFHTGQLLLTSEYEHSEVTLTGRSTGLLPAGLKPSHLSMTKGRLGLLTTLSAAVLAFVAYSSYYPLFSGSASPENHSKSQINAPRSVPNKVNALSVNKSMRLSVPAQQPLNKVTESFPIKVRELSNNEPDSSLTVKQQLVATSHGAFHTANIHKPFNDRTMNNSVDERFSRKAIPVYSMEESDLERELNQPKTH